MRMPEVLILLLSLASVNFLGLWLIVSCMSIIPNLFLLELYQ